MGNIFSFELIRCDSISSLCWDCVARQAIYTYHLEESLSKLKTALDELKEKRDDVMRKVNIAEQQSLKPLNEVQGWLSRAATMINEVDHRIIDGNDEIKKLCMGGCCSMNYCSTLKFSKSVVQTLHEVELLKRKGAFEAVATEVPTAPVVERPSDSTIGMESTLNKVWSILEEKHVRIAGIYGVGGVGKTRLLTEINNKIGVSSNAFDLVIWVTVSKGFYIEKVQEDIAKRVGLYSGMWEEKTAEEKAMDIFRVLREKKFVLLMDDIWERVDLLKVGIPLTTSENGSKIIFTTRSIDVCGQMKAHTKIEVQCLTKEMAWDLFEEHVGNDILDCHPNIRQLAHEVAKECGGLPLALITIARAMACKRTLDGIKIPGGLISGFSKLQMLRMIGSFLFQESAVEDNNECLVEEMQSLNHLNELSVSVTSDFALERIVSAEMLHTCTDQIGLHTFRGSKQLNILSLVNFKCLNYIQLSKCESLEEVKMEWGITEAREPSQIQIPVIEPQPCFQSLVKVYISGCSRLREITWLILAPNLRHFIVIDCHKMEEIINEVKLKQVADMVGSLSPFAKLKSLYLQYLPGLKSIYRNALPFPCMKDIHVYACPKLRRLPLNSNNANRNEIRIHGKEKWWKELRWEDESTRNAFLPCFIAEVIFLNLFCYSLIHSMSAFRE